jgi:hypothetical protein
VRRNSTTVTCGYLTLFGLGIPALVVLTRLVVVGHVSVARELGRTFVPEQLSHPADSITADPGVRRTALSVIDTTLTSARGWIAADLGVLMPLLQVRVFADHRAFAHALRRMQHVSPQSEGDNLSNVVGDSLLLGPVDPSYLRHNLVHVYTEWVLDRLTGNQSDRLPSNPWLYDGIAEFEAYRHEPGSLPCHAGGSPPFNVTAIHSPARWLRLRAGPLGSLEYCLAFLRVRYIVGHTGLWRLVAHIETSDWSGAHFHLHRKTQELPWREVDQELQLPVTAHAEVGGTREVPR